MASYVFNEWFWADLRGDNREVKKAETFGLLIRFGSSSHRMVIAVGSAFDNKAWSLCKAAPDIGRIFMKTIRLNSERCHLLHGDSWAPFPEELSSKVKPADRYLVQTCLAVPESILITTDRPLLEAVTTHGIPCLHRNEFLQLV